MLLDHQEHVFTLPPTRRLPCVEHLQPLLTARPWIHLQGCDSKQSCSNIPPAEPQGRRKSGGWQASGYSKGDGRDG